MNCVHYWRIETGMTDVLGRCLKCGAERMFKGGWLDPGDMPAVYGKTGKPRHKGLRYAAEEVA